MTLNLTIYNSGAYVKPDSVAPDARKTLDPDNTNTAEDAFVFTNPLLAHQCARIYSTHTADPLYLVNTDIDLTHPVAVFHNGIQFTAIQYLGINDADKDIAPMMLWIKVNSDTLIAAFNYYRKYDVFQLETGDSDQALLFVGDSVEEIHTTLENPDDKCFTKDQWQELKGVATKALSHGAETMIIYG